MDQTEEVDGNASQSEVQWKSFTRDSIETSKSSSTLGSGVLSTRNLKKRSDYLAGISEEQSVKINTVTR